MCAGRLLRSPRGRKHTRVSCDEELEGTMDLHSNLEEIYWRMEKAVAPGLRGSQSIYEEVLNLYVKPGKKWLDLGCGHHVLPEWRGDQERELVDRCGQVVGVDADVASLPKHRTIRNRVAADIDNLPFAPGSFDLVSANMVVEHLDDPLLQFQEVSRVLEKGGIFIFHTPHKLGYPTIGAMLLPRVIKGKLISVLDGRPAEDVFPTFYRANTRKTITSLAADSGLEVVNLMLIVSSAVLMLIPPLAFFELILIRMLMSHKLAPLRTHIIAVLRKQ